MLSEQHDKAERGEGGREEMSHGVHDETKDLLDP